VINPHDAKGYPVYPGDLLRTPHHRGARRKMYYLYHTAVLRDGVLMAVPTAHLDPSKVSGGGVCCVKDLGGCVIVQGYGPSGYLTFDERPRAAIAKATAK